MPDDDVQLDLAPLQRFSRDLQRLQGRALENLKQQWAARYLGFARRRFVKFSRGGGDWPPLAPATVRKRRQGSTGRTAVTPSSTGGNVAILRDTGTLLSTLNTNLKANRRTVPEGIEVGFLPQTPAKTRQQGRVVPSQLTVAKLANIHQQGKGNVPQRRIIVEPDEQTLRGMADDTERAMQRMLDR